MFVKLITRNSPKIGEFPEIFDSNEFGDPEIRGFPVIPRSPIPRLEGLVTTDRMRILALSYDQVRLRPLTDLTASMPIKQNFTF